MSRISIAAGLGLALAMTVAACSGGGGSGEPSVETTAATSASPIESNEPSSAPSMAAAAKLNANSASVAELQAAFEAAGVSNADKWAREVAEYRPYPSDPTWAQLRQELGKYNIDPAVLEQIIALLEV